MTTIVHSSDIHVDDDTPPGALSGVTGLRAVIATAKAVRADLLLLAGDTFDKRRVAQPILARVVELVRAAIDADYIALGHWERAAAVGDGFVRAHDSGSPATARSVNVVRLEEGGGVEVERMPLRSS
ncbi:MAG: hypothetical protein FJX57_01955 [Alphaproteobacteria bacterium]|nr:hypothetical protein [Alphaproteobacteria bacterium]